MPNIPSYDDPLNFIEIFTDPIAVLEIATAGPAGPPGATGPSGPPGTIGPTGPKPWDFQGTWSPDTQYDSDDAVSWRGSLYLTNGEAEVGVTPSDDHGQTVHSGWFLVARIVTEDTGGTEGESPLLFKGDVPAGINPVVNHMLGSMEITAQVFDAEDNSSVLAKVTPIDDNSIRVWVGSEEINPVDGTYTVTVITGV